VAESLTNYLLQTRRLIHDVGANYWTDLEITDYINLARNRVAMDTGITRSLQQFSLVVGTTSYNFSLLPQGDNTMEVLGATLTWGNMLIPLRRLSFTESFGLRSFTGMLQRPVALVNYGQGGFMVFPAPDQAYVINLDTILSPTPLTTAAPADTQINYPYDELVTYMAARQAKIEMQDYPAAESFQQLYDARMTGILGSFQQINPYGY